MTKREAAIISAFTGILVGKFSDFHEFVEEILDRPVWTHEMANEEVFAQIKEKSRKFFMSIEVKPAVEEK